MNKLYGSRSRTKGNLKVDYSKIRGNLKNVNPLLLSTLKNAVPLNGSHVTETDYSDPTKNVTPSKLTKLSDIISNNVNAISDLRNITSYIDKADLLWRTILLYPNGKQDKILNYGTVPTNIKSTALHNELLPIWSNYFTNDYKIESRLPDMVSDILINTGSFILFNLSRPGLDYLINGSELSNRDGSESYRREMINNLRSEFTEVGDKILTKNKGVFVRNPFNKDKPRCAKITGFESLIGPTEFVTENEFNIFEDLDPNGEVANITITDNPAIIYLHKLNENKTISDIDRIMGVESIDSFILPEEDKGRRKKAKSSNATTNVLTEEQIKDLHIELYPERNPAQQTMQVVKDSDTLSQQPYGRGITFEVPSEAALPVHINGNNKQKLDLIILFDENGNFLKNTDDADFYQGNPRSNIKNKPKNGSDAQLIAGLRQIHSGTDCEFDMSEFAEMVKSTIIRRLLTSVVSGKGDSVSITIDEEANKIFLSRMFKKQGIRCLYVPGEAVTYMALKHNRLGLGQSLVTNAKLHIARLAAFDIADALANMENAQSHTHMTITPEEFDADPHQSIAQARAAFFEQNPRIHSLLSSGQLSVPMIVDAIRESSLTVTVNTGDNNHMAVPEVQLNRMDKEHFKPINDDSRQFVLNQISNYLCLPKSWLDVSDDQNSFRIEAITENEMVFNQAVAWQESLAEQLVDFQRKHARVNAVLLKKLVDCIQDNKKLWKTDSGEQLEGDDNTKVKMILSDFLNSVYCEFPTPFNIDSTDKLVSSLEAVEKLVEGWMSLSGVSKSIESVSELLGVGNENYQPERIEEMLRSAFLTEAYKRYNLPMPYDEAVSSGEGGGINTLAQMVINQHTNGAEFFSNFIIEKVNNDKTLLRKYKKKIDKALATLEEIQEEDKDEEMDDSPTEDDIGDDSGDSGDDDTASDDDDDSSEEDDTETEEEPEEEPTEPDDDTESDDEESSSGDSQDPESENYNPFR